MEEIWKDIPGYEGLYQISNLGQVKSLNYKHTGKEGILKPSNEFGYLKVKLSKNNHWKNYRVHRLVAQAFIPNPDNLPQVNHKDEDKTNNVVSNLEWCNSKYNNNYGTRNERLCKKVLCVETNQIYSSISEASQQSGICISDISQVANGKRKSAWKLHWKYID